MQTNIDKLKNEYFDATNSYIKAAQTQELTRMSALKSPVVSAEVDLWIEACALTDELNKRRLEAQTRLREALARA